ncbi:acyl-phosphate glycerol 3-phosphate acyltransferase [Metabacillus litoralis]|uniref:Acyl-phosphate glycerol 3-phosphate acyltransferase n=1 Tax=Metabacillus litoralis TaxID=152268 RepID=A0A5C6W4P8_9BACI|nr:lysophospholipid acyltransferase family protein [Metabacillus litoralis]TXC90796.1 acyl-phosphate glycerol 3-phosphate acyltransferase [Metabacillus litoralis]
MIEANKKAWFETVFTIYNRQLLKRYFKDIYLQFDQPLPSQAIFTINHSSWWDALVLFHLNRHVLKHDLFVMMHEKGLKDYPFFGKLGAYSVNRLSLKDIVKALNYSGTLLKEGKSVGLFPQGDEFHLEKRPLSFLPGTIALMEKNQDIPLIPVAFYYSFGHTKKQEIYINVGEPIYYHSLNGSSRKERNSSFELLFTKQLDSLKQIVVNEQIDSFQAIL